VTALREAVTFAAGGAGRLRTAPLRALRGAVSGGQSAEQEMLSSLTVSVGDRPRSSKIVRAHLGHNTSRACAFPIMKINCKPAAVARVTMPPLLATNGTAGTATPDEAAGA
jgi:hypothetical protein